MQRLSKILKGDVEGEIEKLLKARHHKISPDVDLVWVFSGPGTYFEPLKDGEIEWMRWMDHARIRYGMAIFLEIVGGKKRKKVALLSEDEILGNGPIFLYNGIPSENEAFRKLLEFPGCVLPEECVKIVDEVVDDDYRGPIRNTKDQVLSFPRDILYDKKVGRIALVSHAEHLPRILRYIAKYKIFPEDVKVDIFPIKSSGDRVFSESEEKKVWEYFRKGDLSWYPYEGDLG